MSCNYPPETSYGYNTRVLHRAFDRLLQRRLAEYDIRNSHWYFLRILWEREGLTQRELSNETNLTEPSTVIMLNQMEQSGLIRKENDPEDRRKLRVFLTPKARRLEKKLLPIAVQLNEMAAGGISDEDLEAFLRVAGRMTENLLAVEDS